MALLPSSAISVFHFDTDLLDALGKATITNSGAALSTTQSKFGGRSAYFNHAINAYIAAVASSSDIRTVAFWLYHTAYTTTYYPTPICIGPNTDGWRGIYVHSDVYGSAETPMYAVGNSGDSNWSQTGGSTKIPLNAWNHIAITKESTGTFRFFLNGVLQVTITNASPVVSTRVIIGAHYLSGVGNAFDGYLDELLIATTALWTANFTPPTTAYDTPSLFMGQLNNQLFGGV